MSENSLINNISKKILSENYRSNASDAIRTRQKVFRKLLDEVIQEKAFYFSTDWLTNGNFFPTTFKAYLRNLHHLYQIS